MNILILEDEVPAARRILKLVQELLPHATITGPLDSVSATRTYLQTQPKTDLLLADIQLADGLSFELFALLPPKCPVIFTTAFDEYAIRAFRVNSIDYLLKPIDREALAAALEKHQLLFASPEGFPPQLLHQLMQQIGSGKSAYKNRFIVSKGAQLIPIATEEIAWFTTEERVVFLHTHTGRRHICDHTLDELETLLNPLHFYRANRQFIIAAKSVQAAENGFNGKLHLHLAPATTETVVVSREKAGNFKEWLERV